MHILFVDDTFETRDLFRLCFNTAGHATTTAHNGLEALHIIRQNSAGVDVIIMDQNMPQMTGLDVMRELQGVEGVAHIPVILFTGDPKQYLEPEAAELGVARVVQKPILPTELIAIAEEIVAAAQS